MRRFLGRFLGFSMLAACALVATLPDARAQTYPDRPITIVVPLAAGSGMDSLVRLYADKLQDSLGKPVIVENKPGAALMLAAAAGAAAPADGHTSGVDQFGDGHQPRALQEGALQGVKDFNPVSFYVKSPFILVVNPELPAKSVPELIKLAKGSPEPL